MNAHAFKANNHILNKIIKSIQLKEHQQHPIHALNHIKNLMPIIQQQTDDCLFVDTTGDDDIKQITPTLLAYAVMLTLAHCMEQVASYYPIYTFNPYIDIFVRNAENGGLIEKVRRHEALNIQDSAYKNDHEYKIFDDMAMGIEDFINQIRHEMRSAGFKTLVYNAQRVSSDNYDRLLEYIKALFERYARLLVLRVDFGYQRDVDGKDRDWQLEFFEAKRDLKRFLDNMDSNKLFKHVVGYVWKLECGPDKGWHYHVLFFCDGSQVREDVTLAMSIGEYWKKLTLDRGLYFNCNAHKPQYETVCIGMINYYDLHLIDALKNAVKYLTKIDHIARALVPNRGRTFGRKEMPEPKMSNTGRPRSFDPELFY
ncbi:YagK/YfjJ domain-containing protein [Methylomonas rapida]|uniref:Inovirus-type Gp2 protein n=1 Tax=Methylomonas rapida TaxID=2963939 RepID=A0ABY7GHH2_9GAMM|nr:inovirus-type Gp2 protein [Methylomonas rapida]WAR44700.1 inovirus-type Gp2 protein [Methylomonas rapida]